MVGEGSPFMPFVGTAKGVDADGRWHDKAAAVAGESASTQVALTAFDVDIT
jgi:hypothetical protein